MPAAAHVPAVVDEKRMEEARSDAVDERPAPSLSAQSFQHVLIFALFCSNIFFAALAVFFYSNAQCPVVPPRLDPFSISASSRDARAHIRYEQRNFTKPNATAAAAVEPAYVGDPRTTPGLDRAWESLLSGAKFPLSGDEAVPYVPVPSADLLYGQLSVFHNLECLNAVRLALDDDFYREHGPQDGLGWQKTTRANRAPLDRCIDHLRQELQCSADLTVVPVPPRTSAAAAAAVDAELAVQPRTCRRWDDVRSWLDRRHERSRFNNNNNNNNQQVQQAYPAA